MHPLFDGLANAQTEVRDAATRQAIELGTDQASQLLLWEALSPSDRARRLWTFMGVHLRRGTEMVASPRAFSLSHRGTLHSLLEVLARRHGVLVARELPTVVDKPVAIDMQGASLLGVLDEACAQAGCRGGQRARGELIVHDEREPAYPAAYVGPLRVRMIELRSTRATDFAGTTVVAQARLRIEWEWPVGPVGPLEIRIHGVDRRYDVSSVTSVVNIGMVAELLVDLPAAIGPYKVAGTIGAMFEGAYEEVRLPIGASVTLHGLTVTAVAKGEGAHVQIETHDPVRLAGTVDLGVSPMVLGIATNGEEGIPQIHRMRVSTDAPGTERWGLRFRDGFGQLAEVRLRIAALPVHGTLEFALPPVSLP